MKIVINNGFAFSLSKEFYEYHNIPYDESYGICHAKEVWTRDTHKDSRLIDYIEKFGAKAASGKYSYLQVVEIPKGTKYYIDNYDGYESIVTENDISWEVAD
jgi:hypothetical protein